MMTLHQPDWLVVSRLLSTPPTEELAEAIGIDFDKQFVSEYSALLRIPCGSFVPPYLAAHQKQIQPNQYQFTLINYFRKNGFDFEQMGERADHVGVVLEFLALMANQDQEDLEFFDLIKEPLHTFAQKLNIAAETRLYQTLSHYLLTLTESD